jgi:DNA-directed RNA polymerase beta' subunit
MKKDFKFLSSAIKMLYANAYSETDLNLIYRTVISYNNSDVEMLLSQKSTLSYINNLEILSELIIKLIDIFEEREDYDKCIVLKNVEESIKTNREIL